ncbi:MAG: hypothetical protein WCH57_11460 [Verrucomicrobiota bacterium]
MNSVSRSKLTDIIGDFPYRITLAGGWIDQPFCSRLNPTPPGSVCVASIEPNFFWMERSGLATGTRKVALGMWGRLPGGDLPKRVEQLYQAENAGRNDPSGSQDMIGLLYPGISRLDYDFAHRGGVFPRHIENTTAAEPARWLESVLNILPVAPRPPGYNPLEVKRLEHVDLISRLGRTGQICYEGILARDVCALGAAMTETMRCWETLLPNTFTHSTITMDLLSLLKYYQGLYPGACYSSCGGGYLYIASHEPVPGAHRVKIRTA